MPVDWRREDSWYAAATIVAGAFVAYLVAGNFGLVGTPFGRLDAGAAPITPAIASAIETPTASGSASPRPSSTGPPLSTQRPSTDGSAPTAEIRSSGGTSLSLTSGSRIEGTAHDAGSGVDKVVVTFDRGSGDVTTVPASVSCSNAARTSCSWSAEVPDVAGDYEVTAHVTDRSGNTGRSAPIQTTIANPGGTLDDLLPDDVVDQLLGLLVG